MRGGDPPTHWHDHRSLRRSDNAPVCRRVKWVIDPRGRTDIGQVDRHRRQPGRHTSAPLFPPLRDAAGGRRAAEQLGQDLAARKYRIVVYSALPGYVERDVVRGFVQAGGSGKKSIRVIYPAGDVAAAAFPERHSARSTLQSRRGSQLRLGNELLPLTDAARRRRLARRWQLDTNRGCDRPAHRTPLAAISAYGGAAQQVRNSIVPGRDLPSETAFNDMAQPQNTKGWIDGLNAQYAARKTELRRQAGTVSALVALVLLAAWVLSLPAGYLLVQPGSAAAAIAGGPVGAGKQEAPAAGIANGKPAPGVEKDDWEKKAFIFLIFLSPMVAGTSGATIRMLTGEGEPATMRTSVLGVAAASIASLLYILAQLMTNPDPYSFTLLMFGVAVGFLAGFTFDSVLKQLAYVAQVAVEISRISRESRRHGGWVFTTKCGLG